MAFVASKPVSGFARRVSLRVALKLDTVVTAVNGAAYLVAAGPLGDLLGLSPPLLRGLGVVLVAFAALVWLSATRPAIGRPVVLVIVAVNAVWVLVSIGVAISGWMSPTTVGTLWIVAQAIVVAGFAELQAAALKR